ncbi:MAG: hypothetical protein ACFFAO_16725, partial [Candidatus Hermodarchaeota archaeon]
INKYMSLQDSLNELHQRIKDFQGVAKSKIFNLGKIRMTVFNLNDEPESMTLTLVLFYLRNTINEILKSKIKLKDFSIFQKSIKRLFQKFIDTNDLISIDKEEGIFKKLNSNDSISPFKLFFCDLLKEKVKNLAFNDKCYEIKDSLSNFDRFKEIYQEFRSIIQYLETLTEKFEKFQNILKRGNFKKIDKEELENFRLFRSFYPLNYNSEYLIDIRNKTLVKL